MKVVGIVQARMASSRLPGKVLLPVLGKPLIAHELERLMRAKTLNELWLATSEDSADDPLAAEVEKRGFRVFRGSQDDVLERFYFLAQRSKADVIVRLTGDCPLHDPAIVDFVVASFLQAKPRRSYASNVWPPTFPDGLDVEAFTFAALKEAALRCTAPLEREHVTPGIHGQIGEPKPAIVNVTAPADFSHMRWTLDYPEDYAVIRAIYQALYPANPEFTWMDVLALMTREPALLEMNRRSERNEAFTAQLGRYLEDVRLPIDH